MKMDINSNLKKFKQELEMGFTMIEACIRPDIFSAAYSGIVRQSKERLLQKLEKLIENNNSNPSSLSAE